MKSAYEYNKELIQGLVPSMSYNGGDFQEWKASARKKLSQLLGLDKFERVSLEFDVEYQKKIDGATEIRFTYQSEAGYRVPCHL